MGKWDLVKLGDVCEIVSGSTPSTSNPELWNGDIKWVTPAELSDDSYFIYDTERHISEKAGLKPMPAGTVLLSSRAPIGKVAIAGKPMCCNQGFKNLICSERVHNRYLYRWLKNQTAFLNSLGRGATFKEVSKSIVEDIVIPLPPLAMQVKIANILDRAAALIETRKAQMAKLDYLVKSRFIEMFGDPVTNPMGHMVCKMGDVVDAIDPQPSHRTPPISNDGVPYIGIAECNYKTLKIEFGRARKVGFDVLDEHRTRYSIDMGDFIIGKIGTIGKPFFLPTHQDFTLSANTVLIKPINTKIAPIYLFILFQSDYIENQIQSERKTTSQPALGILKVRNIDVLLPPIDLQHRFADFVYAVEKSKSKMRQGLDKLELLYKSLMQKYFNN
jgi:type I restriction enzyme S subunit